MSGTKTLSSQSKTWIKNKRLSTFLSAALVACMLFLGAGLPTYAAPSDNTYGAVTLDLSSYTVAGHLTLYQIVDDFGEIYNLDQNNGTYELSLSPASGYVSAVFRGVVTANRKYTFNGWDGTDPERTLFGNYSRRDQFTIGTVSGQNVQRVSAESLFSGANINDHSICSIRQVTSNIVDINTYGVFDSEFLGQDLTFAVSATVFATYRIPVNSTNFNQVLDSLTTQTVAVTSGTNSFTYNCYASDLNTLEVLEEMDAYLDSISRYQQSTYAAVLSAVTQLQNVNTNLSAVRNYLDSVVTYLRDISSDVGSIYGEVSAIYNMLDAYLNPSEASGVSSSLASVQESLESQASVADSAVEEAIPSADEELAKLESYSGVIDLQTTHATAINFWKQVGEYILDPINLGAAASVLIAASVLAFIVFLLRL